MVAYAVTYATIRKAQGRTAKRLASACSRHLGTKVIALDAPSGCVCGDIRNQMEGTEERYNRLASAGLCMSGHTQCRVIGILGLPSACFCRTAHVLAYSRSATPAARQAQSHPLMPTTLRSCLMLWRLVAATSVGMIINAFGFPCHGCVRIGSHDDLSGWLGVVDEWCGAVLCED